MRALLTVLALVVPRAILACPVCFGQNDSPLANAMNNGILLMLGVVGAVLIAFASFFIYLMRRARIAGKLEEPVEAGGKGSARAAGHTIRGREGTAQC